MSGNMNSGAADRAADMPLLAVDGVRKSFGGIRALDGVSLSVRRGEIHALSAKTARGNQP